MQLEISELRTRPFPRIRSRRFNIDRLEKRTDHVMLSATETLFDNIYERKSNTRIRYVGNDFRWNTINKRLEKKV